MDGLNPITRKEVFLAAAGGQDVETPTPVTREEAFLDAIVKGGGSSLPSTETASAGDVLSLDDNKEPQWAAPSGGGGVLVVNVSDGAFDKKYSEILASTTPVVVHQAPNGASYWGFVTAVFDDDGEYTVAVTDSSAQAVSYYIADSADGYPELEQGNNAPK